MLEYAINTYCNRFWISDEFYFITFFKSFKKMRLVTLCLFLLSTLLIHAQCPSGPIELSTQQQVDNFSTNYPGCMELNKSLFIHTSAVNNLNGLSQITSVGLEFYVQNTSITNFSGLNNLTFIGSETFIFNNQSLTSLQGLDNLATTSGSGTQTTSISNSPLLTDISSLSNLSDIGAGLFILSNTGITDLTGLENIDNVWGLAINNNANLTSFNGLNSSLDNLSFLQIVGNQFLSDCAVEGICQTINNIGAIDIQNNATGCNNFSQLEAACLLLLPVELKYWKAELRMNEVYLHWQTASETQNAYFQIEHSTDGITFEKIDEINGVGNSTETINYEYIHKNPAFGLNYYRLKQTDFDGTFSYSKIISVYIASNDGRQPISIAPNPGVEVLSLINVTENVLAVKLYDMAGKYLFSIELNDSENRKS
ncbi:MAG: hypothetical protein R2788_05745 [Saprospiraceae bacterium]